MSPSVRYKVPESVLVVIHTDALDVLNLFTTSCGLLGDVTGAIGARWTVGANFVYRDLKKAMEDFDTSYIIDAYCSYAGISAANCGQINGAGYVLLNPGSDLVITPDSTTFPFLAGQEIIP